MNKTNIFILSAFILAVIAYHLFGYIGHYGYDDLHYAKLAVDFNRGVFDPNDHFSYRTPVLLLTALSYSVFGISDFASSIPSILVTVAILFIVYSLLRKKGIFALITGLTLTVFSHWFIFYSDKLMPDLYVALSVVFSLYVIHWYKFSSTKKNPLGFSILLSFSLLFGFMSKGTVVLLIPVLIYLALVDLFYKRDRIFWIYSIMAGLFVFSGYFLLIGMITGDFFMRFEAVVNNSYLNLCSYEEQPLMILFKRIAYQFFLLLIYQAMATGILFLLAFLLSKKSTGILKVNDSFSFWAASGFILLLSSNFMSISLTSYSPMCLDPRHYLFLIPVVSISASDIITGFVTRKDNKLHLMVALACVVVVSYFLEGNSFLLHYFPLFILFGLYLLLKPGIVNQVLFVVLFVVVLMLKPAAMVNYALKTDYRKQKEIFMEHVINRADSCTVISNDVQKRLGQYYNKFSESERIRFVNYREFKNDSLDSRKKILFMNGYTRNLSALKPEDLPYYARNVSEKNKPIYRNEELKIEIYEMNDIIIPEQSFIKLLHTINTFEQQITNWSYSSDKLSTEVRYNGNTSGKIGEYSSSFEYGLDSLNLDGLTQFSVRCHFYCYFLDKTNAKLVVSFEDKEGAYSWHGLEINQFIKAYSNWWPVQHEVIINAKEVKRDSQLKVYIWNMDKDKAFVDDFEVTISGYQ